MLLPVDHVGQFTWGVEFYHLVGALFHHRPNKVDAFVIDIIVVDHLELVPVIILYILDRFIITLTFN